MGLYSSILVAFVGAATAKSLLNAELNDLQRLMPNAVEAGRKALGQSSSYTLLPSRLRPSVRHSVCISDCSSASACGVVHKRRPQKDICFPTPYPLLFACATWEMSVFDQAICPLYERPRCQR